MDLSSNTSVSRLQHHSDEVNDENVEFVVLMVLHVVWAAYFGCRNNLEIHVCTMTPLPLIRKINHV